MAKACKKRHIARWCGVFAIFAIGAIWVGNTSGFATIPDGQSPRLLAHRGVHQTNGDAPRGNNSCTANPVAPITHSFIENTIPSMRAAAATGADVIELDLHLTPDDVFAVFHDWTLDCRTDGSGVTTKTPYTDLRGLDIGYGYTDDGVTFPLRGQGVGLMPTLTDVLAAQIGPRYLVNFKSDDPLEGARLVAMLQAPENDAQGFGVYGGAAPT